MTKSQWVLATALAATLPAFGFAQHDDTVRLAENTPFNAAHGRVTSIEFVRGAPEHSAAGATVGNEVGKQHASSHDYYKVSIHFRDEREEAYSRDSVGDLRVGDRVRVSDGGGIERD